MTSSKGIRGKVSETVRTVATAVSAAMKVVLPKGAPKVLDRFGLKTKRIYVLAEHITDGMVTDGCAVFRWDSVPLGKAQDELVANAIFDGNTVYEKSGKEWVQSRVDNPPPVDAVAAKTYSREVTAVSEGVSERGIKSVLNLTLDDGTRIAVDAEYLAPLLTNTSDIKVEVTSKDFTSVIRVTRGSLPIAYIGAFTPSGR